MVELLGSPVSSEGRISASCRRGLAKAAQLLEVRKELRGQESGQGTQTEAFKSNRFKGSQGLPQAISEIKPTSHGRLCPEGP